MLSERRGGSVVSDGRTFNLKVVFSDTTLHSNKDFAHLKPKRIKKKHVVCE